MPYYKVTVVHYVTYPIHLGAFIGALPDDAIIKVERRESWRH
jgi:hypothetical protein